MRLKFVYVTMVLMLLFPACGGSSTSAVSMWTWMSGSSDRESTGVYGTMGVAASTNVPGARSSSASWVGSGDTAWIFGGYGWDGAGNDGYLSDLWRYDGVDWTWVSGDSGLNSPGVYGTLGSSSPSSKPGARQDPVTWVDGSGNLWMFGGWGYGESGAIQGYLNDLWRYDGSRWTWIAGSKLINANGVYGTLGSASGANVPGSRFESVQWVDAGDNLMLFGGFGYDESGPIGYMNDLWRFDGSNWTWVAGSRTIGSQGVYGTLGSTSPSSYPGARSMSASFVDSSGNAWVFGGQGFAVSGTNGTLNDLWRYDGADWTWMSGNNDINTTGVYGNIGSPAGSNVPGSRIETAAWIDGSGIIWLFGGYGYDSASTKSEMGDLWRFDGTNWTWMGGSNTVRNPGVYGSKGESSASNVPGARYESAYWKDSSGGLWLFGGYGNDSTTTRGELGDLWRYSP